ncbi:MAG: glycosyltransferase family 39 protein [Candidatus Solibacter sp.]
MDQITPSPSAPRKFRTGTATAWAALSVFLIVVGTATAYFRTFGTRPPFDDEGLFINWIQGFMGGQVLYDQVHAIFGPAYFLYQWLGCLLTGTQPSNDSVRLVSSFFWVVVAFLAFLVVRRTTGSWVLALISHLLVFETASFIGQEPAHPQELCLLAVLLVAAISSTRWPKRVQFALYGAIAGVLICTKINAGILLIIALTVASVFAMESNFSSRVARIACALGVMLFVPLLLWPNLGQPWAQRLLTLELCSLIAVLVTIWQPRTSPQLTRFDIVAVAGAFGTVVGSLLLFAIARGSTVSSMIDWMIVIPRKIHGGQWYLPLEMPFWYTLWALSGVFLALTARTGLATPRRIAILKTVLGASVLAMAASHRYGALIGLSPAFIWLTARPISRECEERFDAPGRNLMAMLAVVCVLYAYPVAGAQIRFADVVLAMAASVVLGDALRYWAEDLQGRTVWWMNRAAVPAAIGLILFGDVLLLAHYRQTYMDSEPLNLPGAARLRLPAAEARSLQEISRQAKEFCSLLFTVPGMPSFNLWTGIAPPAATLVAFSIGLDDDSQRRLITDISAAPRPCVIYNPAMAHLWTQHTDISRRPIIRFLTKDFRDVLVSADNQLKVRNESVH